MELLICGGIFALDERSRTEKRRLFAGFDGALYWNGKYGAVGHYCNTLVVIITQHLVWLAEEAEISYAEDAPDCHLPASKRPCRPSTPFRAGRWPGSLELPSVLNKQSRSSVPQHAVASASPGWLKEIGFVS